MQRAWDDAICGLNVQHVLENSSGADTARLLASSTHALPSANMGLLLSNKDIKYPSLDRS